MKRIFTTILSLGLLVAPALSIGSTEQPSGLTAAASAPAANTDALVYPASYEEYLPLTAPSDTAVSADFTAISEENKIYVYKRSENVYSLYTHDNNADPDLNKISEMQFSEDGDLYFLDGNQDLYKLTENELETRNYEPTKTCFNCSAFTVFSNTLFYTKVTPNVKSVLKATLSDTTSGKTIVDGLTSNPIVTQDAGVLYYTQDEYLYKYTETQTKFEIYDFDNPIHSFCVSGNLLCCVLRQDPVDKYGAFFVYDLARLLSSERNEHVEPLFSDQVNDYSSVYCLDGYAYAVGDLSVKQFSLNSLSFTDYEIGASSYSKNRLFNVKNAQLCGSTLISIDNYDIGGRINLFNTKTKAHRNVPVEIKANLLASDGNTALIANDLQAELYDLKTGNKLRAFSAFDGDLHGIAAVYGKYYFMTHRGTFYRAEESNGQWALMKNELSKTSAEPKLLTSDVYGNLYVSYVDGSVYRFTEEQFVDPTHLGEKLDAIIDTNATKIVVDYEGNLYAQTGNVISRHTKTGAKTDFSTAKALVYNQTEHTALSTFAFSVEENQTYLFYNGNFAVSTADLGFKTVKDVPVQTADDEIFSEQSAVFEVVKTWNKALIIHFDIDTLNGAETFPYLSYERTTSEKTALKIGETEEYYVLAELNNETKTYSTFITKKEFCTALDKADYLVTYTAQEQRVGYLTNEIRLYKYPYLNIAL